MSLRHDSPSRTCAPPEAVQLLESWVAAVNDRDSTRATSLYARDAMVFWGTFGDHCRTTTADTLDYFERFLAVDTMHCRIDESHWQQLGEGVAVVGGWYEFEVRRAGNPEPSTLKARFTFTLARPADGNWRIVVHHSSLFPADGY